jgi:hypothetical protein
VSGCCQTLCFPFFLETRENFREKIVDFFSGAHTPVHGPWRCGFLKMEVVVVVVVLVVVVVVVVGDACF